MDFRSYRLYEQGAGQSRRIVALITRAKGERMVRSKTAEAGLDLDGETMCFLRIDASNRPNAVPTFIARKPASSVEDVPIEVSSTAFSQPEMMAIAGTKFRHGRSRTARMSEAQREARVQRIFADGVAARSGFGRVYGIKAKPEDLVERATNKYDAWAKIPVLMDRMREVSSL